MRRRSALLFSGDKPTPQFADFMGDIGVPGKNLAEINAALQARFFQKNLDGSQKERWELEKVQINCPIERIKEHLAACGFMDKTIPAYKNYNYAVWPGGLVVRAAARLGNLADAWNSGVRWEQIIVLGGKRELQKDKENCVDCCKAIRVDLEVMVCSLWQYLNPQTELDMMRWLWHCVKIPPELKERLTIFVDAPIKPVFDKDGNPVIDPKTGKQREDRPTTEDTVRCWLETSKPKPGSVLLSSGAPYGMAQDEALWTLLEPHGFTVETFGHAAPDLPIENFMREVAGCVNRIYRARKV